MHPKSKRRGRRHGRFSRGFSHVTTGFNRVVGGNGLYRSRKGIFLGVCRGVAEYFNFSVFWTRIITLVIFFLTGFWPVVIGYILAGLVMKPAPVSPLHTERDKEFYDTYTSSRDFAVQRVKRKYDNINRRIQRMEHTVTSREFDWD